ncbi:hypothetical protein N4G69_43000 [Streptomyces mirabilis]|uniref:hypothetical protein n=1 Tax=Streptomyces mirabilis TaxID=68239 RepID=UPI0021C14267|nr:hypothetical protein [Streptomyces mirabilis]MCT9112278.1 hypothetical protein [Streptomyces mirabilis]
MSVTRVTVWAAECATGSGAPGFTTRTDELVGTVGTNPSAPSAAYARSPQRTPSANNPATNSPSRSARRPAAVRVMRVMRRAAPAKGGSATGGVKTA